MAEPRTIAEHGSRIIAALKRAWAAIQDQHPDVPDVVIDHRGRVQPEGHPRGVPAARPPLARTVGPRRPGRAAGPGAVHRRGAAVGRGPRRRWRSCCTRPPTPWPPGAASRTPAPPGNRYHNKRFVALAAELGLRGPDMPDKVTGWSDCTLTGEAYDAYADVAAAIDRPGSRSWSTRPPAGPGGGGGDDQGDDEPASRPSAADGG